MLSGHTDLVHAVEAEHNGRNDSVVLYIPAVPFTVSKSISFSSSWSSLAHNFIVYSAGYLRKQLLNFTQGLPAPDFPGGPGEADFVGRVTPEDVIGSEARKAFGLEEYTEEDVIKAKGEVSEGERDALFQGNMIIF